MEEGQWNRGVHRGPTVTLPPCVYEEPSHARGVGIAFFVLLHRGYDEGTAYLSGAALFINLSPDRHAYLRGRSFAYDCRPRRRVSLEN